MKKWAHMATERWTAYWTMAPRHGVLRTEAARPPREGEALVRTICSGISHGTEMLVHAGRVPPEVAESMRAPFQVGSWPGPVKYGYLSVGVVEEGPASLQGSQGVLPAPAPRSLRGAGECVDARA